VHPREVFNLAIRKSANSIILIHNHPSGDPNPSPEDINITNRLIEAGNIVGITVLDHIIIGDNRYVSFKERSII
jgi:DNA repair protein RadC